MLRNFLIITCLLAAAVAQCGVGELPCGVYCYNPTQYTCTTDPLTSELQLCGVGTSPCNGACIADCGFFCNVTSGRSEPNDDDELYCPPDCSKLQGFGACGNECIDTAAFCCISEVKTELASCPFSQTPSSDTAKCPFKLDSTGQLWDGQLRLSFGPGAGPVSFNLTNGELIDNRGQSCYISEGFQVQCNSPAQTTDVSNFGVTSTGYLTYNGSTQFFQCPVGTGGYNFFSQPPTEDDVCTPVAIPVVYDCPPPPSPPICTTAVDIVVVVDMSGSVSNKQFRHITEFTLNFASQFDFGAQSGRMGLVWFGNAATTKTNGLLTDRAQFYRAANVTRPSQAQSSCLGCGLDVGLKMLKQNARAGVPQVMLVLSDGQNNVPQNTARGCWKWNGRTCIGGSAGVLPAPNWRDEVKELRASSDLTVFGIGVVADGNLQEGIMRKVASPKSYICVGQYEKLVSAVNRIKDATCAVKPNNTAATSQVVVKTTQATPSTTRTPSPSKVCTTRPISLPLPWLYFSFDFDWTSTSSKTCKDNSGNNRHGTLSGAISATTGIWKQAARFFGKKQYISVPQCSSLSSAFSVSTWVHLNGKLSDSVVIAATSQWNLKLCPKSGKVYFSKGSGWSTKTLTWNVALSTSSFFHLSFTVNESGQATLYVDGVSVGSSKSCGSRVDRSSGSLWLCYQDESFEGVFDDLFIFNKCLSKTEVENVRDSYCVGKQ